MIENAKQAAHSVFRQRYPHAECVLLCGSVVRGEATAHSDLDLVVLYQRVDHAYRESFVYSGWPIEVFVHDLSTLRYFCIRMDVPDGKPSLPNMVSEGIAVPRETELSRQAKALANQLLDKGPAPWTADELQLKRYFICDKIDDLRSPRSKEELVATGTQLYAAISDFYFRSKATWSAEGKTIVRKLKESDPIFFGEFNAAFRALFEDGNPARVISLAEALLAPFGGVLFDGFRLDAPTHWRIE